MTLTARKTSAGLAALAAAGVSSAFIGAVPANAVTETCGPVGTLVEPGVCELVFTEGTGTFTPTADMTKLEVLLVGAGGSGVGSTAAAEQVGYAAGGGGGEVLVVDLTGTSGPIEYSVPTPAAEGGVASGSDTFPVENGGMGVGITADGFSGSGGPSGSGQPGASFTATPGASLGGGGGDSAAGSEANGGAGTIVSAIAPTGSLFANDARCFGGGGAAGLAALTGDTGYPAVAGIPGCGAGGPSDANSIAIAAPAANSGGGGGAVDNSELEPEDFAGAAGLIAFRWNSTVVLPATGGDVSPAVLSIGAAALLAGASLAIAAGVRRKREAD